MIASCIILPADKGNATVVLDAKDYDDKMMSILNEGTYNETLQTVLKDDLG